MSMSQYPDGELWSDYVPRWYDPFIIVLAMLYICLILVPVLSVTWWVEERMRRKK